MGRYCYETVLKGIHKVVVEIGYLELERKAPV